MAKDPAFLFYYTDFMNGTRHFSIEEKGLYITLLCEQADSESGSIPEKHMNNTCKTCDKQVIKTVFEKFKKDASGYYNEVLRNKLNERRKFCESRKNNRLGKKQVINTSKTSVKHVEDENISTYSLEDYYIKLIPMNLLNKALQKGLTAFVVHRQSLGRPINSVYAMEIFLKDLNEYSEGKSAVAIKIMEKSIRAGYSDIFKPKKEDLPQKPARGSNEL